MSSDFIEEVRAERERQKSVEGWTAEHDDMHERGELGSAARAYQLAASYLLSRTRSGYANTFEQIECNRPAAWPWLGAWWKPVKGGLTREQNARRCMVKAGALLVAEAERLERLVAKGKAPDA